MERKLIPGHPYRHYKDKWYYVLKETVHSETRKTLVCYFPLYEKPILLFVRPKAMFLEELPKEKQSLQKERFLEMSAIDLSMEERDEILKKAQDLIQDLLPR